MHLPPAGTTSATSCGENLFDQSEASAVRAIGDIVSKEGDVQFSTDTGEEIPNHVGVSGNHILR
jgi:hypothetical protein